MVAAADLFADRDLAVVADVTVIERWPDDIERWAERFPPAIPLMYVGGLENHPELLSRLAQKRPLAGIVSEPLHIVRTPEILHQLLTTHGVPVARLASEMLTVERRWLVKPRKSGGGRGIRILAGTRESVTPDEYVQEIIEGTAGSAAFLATDAGSVELIGTCDGLDSTNSVLRDNLSFGYFGSITNDGGESAALERVGRVLTSIGLRGLFGVDFVRTHDERCVVVEVNPRYTASMELFELQTGRSFVAEQLAAFDLVPRGQAASIGRTETGKPVFGKRIVYAPQDLRVGRPVPDIADILGGDYHVADIPDRDALVPALFPICTVFARAATRDECRAELIRREAEILKRCEPT